MISLFCLLGLTSTSFAVPQQLTQQGRLLDQNGAAVTGLHNLSFSIYDSGNAPAPLWQETLSVYFNDGYYSAVLGSDIANNPLDDALFADDPLYLELEVDSNGPLSPRSIINSGAYSRRAAVAESIDGGSVNALEVKIGGTTVIDSSGAWVGPTFSLNWNQIGGIPNDIMDGDDDTLASLSCVLGQIVGWDGTSWICTDDNGLTESEVEFYITNDPINLSVGSQMGGLDLLTSADLGETLSDLSCIDGEQATWDAVIGWTCAADAILTESQVEGFVTNGSLDLAAATTLNGATILTSADPTIGNLSCGQGEVLSYDAGTWVCTSFQSLLDADGDGVMAWNDCDDGDISLGSSATDNDCDGADTAIDCNDYDPNSPTVFEDGDCDGLLTADDCNDADPNSTALAFDADCDGIMTAADCDDNDPTSSAVASDGDCDGTPTGVDCDDNNPSIQIGVTGASSDCAASSCLAILNGGHSVGDGDYWIDNNGVEELYCDMTNGGWTRVANDTFENSAAGWSNPMTYSCGSYGTILGGYDQFGAGASAQKVFDTALAHTELKVEAEYIKIDTWDNEYGRMYIDGVERWYQMFHHSSSGNQCGQGTGEEMASISYVDSHVAASVLVRFDSNLDSPPYDESWGVDNVKVWVK